MRRALRPPTKATPVQHRSNVNRGSVKLPFAMEQDIAKHLKAIGQGPRSRSRWICAALDEFGRQENWKELAAEHYQSAAPRKVRIDQAPFPVEQPVLRVSLRQPPLVIGARIEPMQVGARH